MDKDDKNANFVTDEYATTTNDVFFLVKYISILTHTLNKNVKPHGTKL